MRSSLTDSCRRPEAEAMKPGMESMLPTEQTFFGSAQEFDEVQAGVIFVEARISVHSRFAG